MRAGRQGVTELYTLKAFGVNRTTWLGFIRGVWEVWIIVTYLARSSTPEFKTILCPSLLTKQRAVRKLAAVPDVTQMQRATLHQGGYGTLLV